jgi:putative ABC transport system substrate-binding protein
VRRRSLLQASALVAAPSLVRAAPRPIGWVSVEPHVDVADVFAVFKSALPAAFAGAEAPPVIERYAEPTPAAVADVVKEMQAAGVSLIVTQGGATRLVVQAKPTVPVVFAFSGDPVVAGVVDSLARPGGNATGMSFMSIALNPKRIGLAREIVPGCRSVALLSNRRHPGEEKEIAACQQAVRELGIDLPTYRVETQAEALAATDEALGKGAQAVLMLSSIGMLRHVPGVAAACTPHKVPLICGWSVFSRQGAVLSYGPKLDDCFRRVAGYVARVSGGASPATLPVELPTSFELVINKRAAAGLGLTVPSILLAQADEVIE